MDLTETYIIFITENDVLRGNLPIYYIERTIRELGHKPFGDGSHIIYVNSNMKDKTALGMLMHDFSCTKADDMHYGILADRVRYFKEDEEGVASMCKVIEEMRAQERAEGRAEAMMTAYNNCRKRGMSHVEAIAISGFTEELYREYAGN